ncbi:MAG: cyclophilin-like fold protein [Armatimonadota bacterium]
MAGKIKIESGDASVEATLNDTITAQEVMEALPIEGSAQTWGDEVYFEIPVSAEPENARETVDMGDLGYWPPGSALCIFFGPTPMSSGDEIRPASPVNVFGKIDGDPTVFSSVSNGDKVTVTEA